MADKLPRLNRAGCCWLAHLLTVPVILIVKMLGVGGMYMTVCKIHSWFKSPGNWSQQTRDLTCSIWDGLRPERLKRTVSSDPVISLGDSNFETLSQAATIQGSPMQYFCPQNLKLQDKKGYHTDDRVTNSKGKKARKQLTGFGVCVCVCLCVCVCVYHSVLPWSWLWRKNGSCWFIHTDKRSDCK